MRAASGFSTTPRSVTMTSMSACGVTSNTGFHAFAPSTTVGLPPNDSISSGARNSISIAAPSGVAMSIVDDGATTMNFTP